MNIQEMVLLCIQSAPTLLPSVPAWAERETCTSMCCVLALPHMLTKDYPARTLGLWVSQQDPNPSIIEITITASRWARRQNTGLGSSDSLNLTRPRTFWNETWKVTLKPQWRVPFNQFSCATLPSSSTITKRKSLGALGHEPKDRQTCALWPFVPGADRWGGVKTGAILSRSLITVADAARLFSIHLHPTQSHKLWRNWPPVLRLQDLTIVSQG